MKKKTQTTFQIGTIAATLLIAVMFTAACSSEPSDDSKVDSETGSVQIANIHGLSPDPDQDTAAVEYPDGESPLQAVDIDVARIPAAAEADQVVIVLVAGDGTASLSEYMRSEEDGTWSKSLYDTPAYIGEDGIGQASEGASVTPQGAYQLIGSFGILPDPGSLLPYVEVDDSHWWVCDSESDHYNKMVSDADVDDFDRDVSEHLASCTPEYDYALVIGCNSEGAPGAGSAFFIHCMGDDPHTAGCVAVSEDAMRQMIRSIGSNALVVIDYEENLPKL